MFTDENRSSFDNFLKKHTKEGDLYKATENKSVICLACAHKCKISIGHTGICKIRYNENGKLMVPTGYIGALYNDPIEKKPFYHVCPGLRITSFGMFGCNFYCDFCQNWDISQRLINDYEWRVEKITPKELCDFAESNQSYGLASTYNEPLITSEWAVEVFKEAKSRNFATCSFVSNGHGTEEVIKYLSPWVDSYKIDLKSFNKKTYQSLGGKLEPVLETIKNLHKKKFWVEIVTLIIPEFNDSMEELKQIAEFIASVSLDIPWHITAFHPNFKMRDRPRTPAKTLLMAYEIGKSAGLHYIYPGNLPGQVGNLENTYCKDCNNLLIERLGFKLIANNINKGCCNKCKKEIPGRWV